MRSERERERGPSAARFLSIQAQDFIEEAEIMPYFNERYRFLSIQAQDFIEECPLADETVAASYHS